MHKRKQSWRRDPAVSRPGLRLPVKKRRPPSAPARRHPPTAETLSREQSREAPWGLRFSPRILAEDLKKIGHTGFALARKAIDEKLTTAPLQYGSPLRHPLHGLLKLKVSHLRVAYYVDVAARDVWILMIADRKSVWTKGQGDILDRLSDERGRGGRR